MKRTQLMVFLLCAGSIAGCVQTYEVGYEPHQTLPRTMSESLEGEEVIVTPVNGGQLEGIFSMVHADTMRLQLTTADTTLNLPLKHIETIDLSGSIWGPILGGVEGCVAGAIIGGVIGRVAEDGNGFFPVKGLITGAVIGSGAGLIAGTLLGLHLSASEQYRFPVDSAKTIVPAHPVNMHVKGMSR